MSDLATTNGWTTPGTAEAVSLPRRHLLALAILVCVPLPALSLAATVIPLPQMLERVTAAFSALATPALGGDGSVIRERKVALGALKITYEPSEQRPRVTAGDDVQGANGSSTRGIPARGAFGAKPGAGDRGGLEVRQVDPGTETAGSDGGTTDSGDAPTSPYDPTDTPSTPEPRSDPPSPTPPAPDTGAPGGGSGGSGGSSGSGGGGTSIGSGGSGGGGSSGSAPTDPLAGGTPPDHGGGPPPDTGTGTPGSGSGSGSPAEPTPPGNGPPAPGDRGKP